MLRRASGFVLCLLPSLAAAQPVQPVQVLHAFTTSPTTPTGPLLQVPDGSFYGLTSDAIYRLATNGQVTTAARLTDGVGANGPLVRTPDGALYGTTTWGGDTGQGTIFRFDPATGNLRTVHTFTGAHEGRSPFDGLTLAGGFLFGVTGSTVFRLEPTTGAFAVLHTFADWRAGLGLGGGLTLGADGMLYGAGAGGIVRVDPGTGAWTVVHTFATLSFSQGRLQLAPDGRLFGSTLYEDAGSSGVVSGAVYRYDPATNTLDVIARHIGASTLPSAPGPLVMTPDGSLYGTTSLGDGNPTATLLNLLFRLRPSGTAYVIEPLRAFDYATTGLSERAQLALGNDGLIYGYAQSGGAVHAGTLYRFDPAGSGPPANTIAFTVLHQFAPTTIWEPSEPTLGSDGRLYGTTNAGGAARRGGIYAIDPVSGAFTHAADIPGAAAGPQSAVNSPLLTGTDGALYGTTSAAATTQAAQNGAVRFVPATSAVTNTIAADLPPPNAAGPPIASTTSRRIYFARDRTVYRLETNGTIAAAGTEQPLPEESAINFRSTLPTIGTGGDGEVYIGMVTTIGLSPTQFLTRSRLYRENQAFGQLDTVTDPGPELTSLAPGPRGLFAGSSNATSSALRHLDILTGVWTSLCNWPIPGLASITPIGGRVIGLTQGTPQRLLLCDIGTRTTEVRTLPAGIGRVRGSLVAIAGALYGATTSVPDVGLIPGRVGAAPALPGGAVIRFVLDGAPPALDTDADGLPSEWETTYGLDPFDGAGDDGANGDPDGDGRTNAQELADGTHPRGTLTRYFAEGATGPFFRTRIDLANPNAGRAASVLLRFSTDVGASIAQRVEVPPSGQTSVDVSTVPGLANATFSTIVEADVPIGVERSMSWDASGYGSTIETGIVAPATTWYLAEGSTSGAFSLFYLLQNPQATAVTATVRYLRPLGLAPIDKTYALPPHSRTTIAVDSESPELASTDVSAVITAASPIVAERAMYFTQGGQPFAAGHESAGVTAAAPEWFLAEGATGDFFDLFVLIANPNPTASTVEIEYLLTGGGALTKTYTVAATSRTTIYVDAEELPAGSGQRPLANAALSMRVRSTNGVPIVVERTMWWPGPAIAPNFWYEAHNSPGATTTATRWVVAGAEVGGAAAAQSYVLIANPGAVAGQAGVTVFGLNGLVTEQSIALPPKSRTNVPFTSGSGVAGVLVESFGTHPVPIVVERATYTSPGGVTWAAGGAALAAPLP